MLGFILTTGDSYIENKLYLNVICAIIYFLFSREFKNTESQFKRDDAFIGSFINACSFMDIATQFWFF